jgi:hypothetical protein
MGTLDEASAGAVTTMEVFVDVEPEKREENHGWLKTAM